MRRIDGNLSVSNRRLVVQDGLEGLRQRCVQHIRFARGEWFLSPQEGVPDFFNLSAEDAGDVIADDLRNAVEDVQRVEVASVEVDGRSRVMKLRLAVISEDGSFEIEETI